MSIRYCDFRSVLSEWSVTNENFTFRKKNNFSIDFIQILWICRIMFNFPSFAEVCHSKFFYRHVNGFCDSATIELDTIYNDIT